MVPPTAEAVSASYKRLLSSTRETLRNDYNLFWQKAERAGQWLDARPSLLIVFLLASYGFVTIPHSYFRPMWHDELITYDLALSPSVAQMLTDTRRIDLNPPVLYLLNYVTLRLPGAHANEQFISLAARLPSLLAGLLASLGLFALMRPRMGSLYGLAAVGLLWNTDFLNYVWEDRPYALLCGFLLLLILVWHRAIQPGRHHFWVGAAFLVGVAMMGSHFFGSFLLLAFLAAEIARAWSRGQPDIPLFIAFFLPLGIPIAYTRIISGYGHVAFPALFQPSILTLGTVYVSLLDSCAYLLAPILVLSLIATAAPAGGIQERNTRPPLYPSPPTFPEWILLLGILVEPIFAVISIMRTHGAFFERYGLPACISIAVLLSMFLSWRFNGLKRVALIVVIASFTGPISQFAHGVLKYLTIHKPHAPSVTSVSADYHLTHPDLPFVDASALTFVEMNHRESPEMLRRTYYLTDASRALRYNHATAWEGEAEVGRMLHFRGTVQNFVVFEAAHPHFLVLGTYDAAEDWLLRALVAEGDTVQYLGKFDTSYKDTDLYEVTIHNQP